VSGCVICPARPARSPLPDSLACQECAEALGRLLDDLDRLLPTLRALMSEVDRSTLDERTHGDAGSYGPAPLNVDVLSLLDTRNPDSPGRVLARWGVAFGTAATPAGLKAALGRIVEREELPAFTRDLRALVAELNRVCGVPQSRIVATCRRELPTPDDAHAECGGPIVATPGGDRATCTACGDDWPRAKWRLLGRLQDA